MKIDREKGKSDRIDISFRYTLQSEKFAKELCLRLNNTPFSYQFFTPTKRRLVYVVIINIEEYFDDISIAKINKELNITENDYGFWFGLDSNYLYGGLTVPYNVVKYIKALGGKIDFSFFICRD
jgi:hypothetical protein